MLCRGVRFIDLPAFDGEVPAQPPVPPNRRFNDNPQSDDSLMNDEDQLLELDKPLTNNTIVINMLGYKGDVPQTTIDIDDIEMFNDVMSGDSLGGLNSEEELTTHHAYPRLRRRFSDRYAETNKQEYKLKEGRRHWLVSEAPLQTTEQTQAAKSDDKDSGLKTKILTLVQQTMHDTETKVRATQSIKDKYRDRAPYRIGFILSMVKKSRDVLNELFNVAVKHRDEWKALEQLKIFELIVHTNVDTTNLVRQLVELHINNLNATQKKTRLRGQTTKHRVVVL